MMKNLKRYSAALSFIFLMSLPLASHGSGSALPLILDLLSATKKFMTTKGIFPKTGELINYWMNRNAGFVGLFKVSKGDSFAIATMRVAHDEATKGIEVAFTRVGTSHIAGKEIFRETLDQLGVRLKSAALPSNFAKVLRKKDFEPLLHEPVFSGTRVVLTPADLARIPRRELFDGLRIMAREADDHLVGYLRKGNGITF